MATALEGVAKLTVVSQTLEPNRAQVLVAQHGVTVDSGAALTKGTEVTYTDPDLGLVFTGKIISVEKMYENGEGVLYRCACPYRAISKTVAKQTNNGFKSSKLAFDVGTPIVDAITAVLSDLNSGTLFPGGIDTTDVPAVELPLMDKGGQFMSVWIDDILAKTDGIIALSDLTAAPKLVFLDYYNQPEVTLTEGSFNIITLTTNEQLFEGGRQGQSINGKVKSVYVEGGGQWHRVIEEFINIDEIQIIDQEKGVFNFIWKVPNNDRITCKYITPEFICDELCQMRLRVGGPDNPAAFQVDIDNPSMGINENGERFWFVNVVMKGFATGGSGEFLPPQIEAWFTYTRYEGPLTVDVSSADPALENEGDMWEFHEEFFKYTSDDGEGEVDFTPELEAIRDALYAKYSGDPDEEGTIRVHMNGIDPDLHIGSKITNFNNARVQKLTYDFVRRTQRCDLSNNPIRDVVERAKQAVKDGTLEQNRWYVSRTRAQEGAVGCFNNVSTFLDENGDPKEPGKVPDRIDPNNPGGGGLATTWDCMNGNCVQVQGPQGQYNTQRDCLRVCGNNKRWTCIDCGGCVQVEDANAPFETEAECIDAQTQDPPICFPPDAPECGFNCDPVLGCVPNPNGIFPSRAACEAVCFKRGSGPGGSGGIDGSGQGTGHGGDAPISGSGSGPGDVNTIDLCCSGSGVGGGELVVKCITLDDFGHVRGISCTEVTAGAGSGTPISVIEDVCYDATTCEYKIKRRTIYVSSLSGEGSPESVSECP